MKLYELPEQYKQYEIVRRDGKHFRISGELKQKIVRSQSQFFELPDGSIVNRVDIVGIDFDREDTKDVFDKLPEGTRKQLMSSILPVKNTT